ncbi:hypothetical protein FACS1894120_3310 [Clostridia bacterium]|nr:hypothetical protein FACS1894120_3310 [Clostridia bacterium]
MKTKIKTTDSLKFRMATLVVVPLAVIALCFMAIGLNIVQLVVNEGGRSLANSIGQVSVTLIEQWTDQTQKFTESFVAGISPELAAAVKKGDTEKIIALAKPTYDAFSAGGLYISGMTFADNEGNALARVTSPAKFGDNIKTSAAIADGMAGKSVAYVYPTTNNGFSIAAGTPIVWQGEQIGVLFVSKRLDNDTVMESLRKYMYDGIVILYQGDTPVWFSEETAETSEVIPEIKQAELAKGNIIFEQRNIGGKSATGVIMPLAGRDDAHVGAIAIYSTSAAKIHPMYIYIWFIMLLITVVVLVPVLRKVISGVVHPIEGLVSVVLRLQNGDLSADVRQDSRDEIGVLQGSVDALTRQMRHQADSLRSLAAGDYSGNYTPVSGDDSVGISLAEVITSGKHTFGGVTKASKSVLGASKSVSDAAATIANLTTDQATSVDTFARSLSDIRSVVDDNTKLAQKAHAETESAGKIMESGVSSMSKLNETMQRIKSSSSDITKVIKVIDDIAFQTNILALNAAVEAARAGEAGKGFAVVADEVRNLASKSADAAKETTELIKRSTDIADEGARITAQTSDNLLAAAERVSQNAVINAQIAESCGGLAVRVNEISSEIGSIQSSIEANAATAEESAASADTLEREAESLELLVRKITL